MLADERLYRIVVLDEIMKDKSPLAWEDPICPVCFEVINVLDGNVAVSYRVVSVGDREYTVIDPRCPECGTYIQSRVSIVC